MTSSATMRGFILTAVGLAQSVNGYLPGTGSFVAGNLSSAAPYGIPPDEFGNITERVLSTATFNMTGYNVSANIGPSADPGWTLTVGVTTDVSLVNAANKSNLDFEATTLSIEPPEGNTTIDASWKICAVVFTGLANDVDPSTTVDGTCGMLLSSGCIQAIESGSSGMDDNGTCTTYTLPSACASSFPADSAENTAFDINQTVLDAKRFYAYGSPSTQTTNATAYEEAVENVWPVITLFSHISARGTRASLNTAIQCIRASNGTTTAPSELLSDAGRHGIPTTLTTPGLILVVSLAALLSSF